MSILEIPVVSLDNPQRIIQFLLDQSLTLYPTKNSLKKALKKELVELNGVEACGSEWLRVGDTIIIRSQEKAVKKIFPLSVSIVYEDNYLAIINKPAGIAVSGNFFKTIQNALPFNLKASSNVDGLPSPMPVHRLDKLTSGLLLVAKTKRAQVALGHMFEKKMIHKTYHALVKGRILNKGTFNGSINKLMAQTTFKSVLLKKSLSYDWITLVELSPITGRTHQIRIHLSTNNTPIIGDCIYDSTKVLKGKGLFLCATEIKFTHPILDKVVHQKIDLPHKFKALMSREEKRHKIFNKT